jgi:hypothetical protein
MESRLKKKLILITIITFAVPFIILSSVFIAYVSNIAYINADWQDGELIIYGQPLINAIIAMIVMSLIISLIVSFIFFIILLRKYSKEEAITISFQDRIKDKTAIEIDELRKLFRLDKPAFYTTLLEWVERFEFVIDGDYILTNDDTILDAIDSLKETQKDWGK